MPIISRYERRGSKQALCVIASASEAIQGCKEGLDCFVARDPRNDGERPRRRPGDIIVAGIFERVLPAIASPGEAATNSLDRVVASLTSDRYVAIAFSLPLTCALIKARSLRSATGKLSRFWSASVRLQCSQSASPASGDPVISHRAANRQSCVM
jgi:hypothetical protein